MSGKEDKAKTGFDVAMDAAAGKLQFFASTLPTTILQLNEVDFRVIEPNGESRVVDKETARIAWRDSFPKSPTST